ncbi:hypothetical protein F0919_03865 [Taibaiella lutea]|uniref:Uncharacterized protein n=1 Tax=Taibaiella lutea TaxID=2608001 RepID=A0A5M6CNZ7_9BACT|nr:hypothetical protein [Taibaiella lutea]KAA5536817.1 hypothetical protein F0919_03865 [Taibaiella lutea]
MKKAYYYLYYKICKAFSKDDHPLFSVGFRADVVVMALKIWTAISLYSYLSILLGYRIKLSITEPLGLIPIALALGSTLYFFTFSNKWKPYFEEFEKLPKRKNLIGGIIVWGVAILSFINFIISVNLMKNSLR